MFCGTGTWYSLVQLVNWKIELWHLLYNKEHWNLTRQNPVPWFQFTMVAYWEQFIGMVTVPIWSMADQWQPLGFDQIHKTLLGGGNTPIQMVLYCFCPVFQSLTPLIFTCFKDTLCNCVGHMPSIIKMGSVWLFFMYPLADTRVSIWYENGDLNLGIVLKVWKAPLCSFQFHLVAASSLIWLHL